jgi:hypothetical protein
MRRRSRTGTFDTAMFEEYSMTLFYNETIDPKKYSATVRNCASIRKRNKAKQVSIGGCSSIKVKHDIVEAAIENEMVLFAPVSTNYPLIDFMYRAGNDYNLFQSTVSEKGHTASKRDIVGLVTNIINRTAPDLLQPLPTRGFRNPKWKNDTKFNLKAMAVPKIHLYYVVPHWIFDTFVTTPVNPNVDAQAFCKNESESFLSYFWEDLVSIKVLSVNEPIVDDPLIDDPQLKIAL